MQRLQAVMVQPLLHFLLGQRETLGAMSDPPLVGKQLCFFGDLWSVANIHRLRKRYLIGGKPLFLELVSSQVKDLLSSHLYFLMMLRHTGGQNLYKSFKGAGEC